MAERWDDWDRWDDWGDREALLHVFDYDYDYEHEHDARARRTVRRWTSVRGATSS